MNARWWAVGALGLVLVGIGFMLQSPLPARPALPGVDDTTLSDARQEVLAERLERALRHGWRPRTRHLADGRPLYTNRLLEASSPYLRQHAHNPVNWFPWGDEALALAASLDRPMFLSIGYATCHWCHVMEEESFEDPEVAAFLNAHFIAVKVDRETRPDLDGLYLEAVRALHGRAGWPATLVLHPDGRPFFGATYLPARDGDRGRSKGLLTVLQEIEDGWRTDRPNIDTLSTKLAAHLQKLAMPPLPSDLPGPGHLEALVQAELTTFDAEHGGQQKRPKFPSDLPVRALLLSDTPEARAAALKTLDAWAIGGLYDHVAGGFHRYSVDERWDVPHFEKMLYDQAVLARLYGEAFQSTRDLRYAHVVDETLEALLRDLGVSGGGFASALDADSLAPSGEREEGRFATWTPAEITAVLKDDAPAFARAFGVTEVGDLDGRNVLRRSAVPTLEERRSFRKSLLALHLARRSRPAPLRDDKVLTGWNGLAIAALAYNGWLFQNPLWIQEAEAAAGRLLDNRIEGRLTRTDGPNGPEGQAFLDDYAYLVDGLITLFEATGEPRWLTEARSLTTIASTHHGMDTGPWALAADDHEALLTREKPVRDGPMPGPNSVMLANLIRLATLTGDDAYREQAVQLARGLPFSEAPQLVPDAAVALLGLQTPLKEIVLVHQEGERSSGLHAALRTLPPSRRVLVQQVEGRPPVVPLAADKVRLDGPTVYVCEGGVCERPTTDPAELAALLAE